MEDVEIPLVILGDGAFPLQTFMSKPHGDAILADDKRYFDHRNSRTRLVTDGAFVKLKIRSRGLFCEYENSKKTVKLYNLTCVVPHNLCIERGDLFPRKFDLTLDHALNKRLSPEKGRDALALRNTNQNNLEVNNKPQALKVRIKH